MKKTATLMLRNGTTLFYRKNGHGPQKVLLIHDLLASSRYFQPLLTNIDVDRFALYAADLPSSGHSDALQTPLSYQRIVADLTSFCEHLHLQDLIVIGWGAGCQLALSLAAQHSELVKGLLLLAPTTQKLEPTQKETAIKLLAQQTPAPMTDWLHDYFYPYMTPSFQEDSVLTPETLLQRDFADLSTAFEMQLTQRPKISQPFQVLAGKMDALTTPDLADCWPDALTTTLQPHCGHQPLIDAPQAVLQQLNQLTEALANV